MNLNLMIGGKPQRVQAQIIKGVLWVHHEGRTYTSDVSSGKRSRKGSGSKSSSDQIISPMPGKITKIFLHEGQPVLAGQPVLVMEAMKMEYTLKAEISGVIESVQCALNDQVILGKTLVRIKAVSDK